jgi:S-adenosylmethionine:tRNA ribosyltransferase-isomerase
MLLSEFDVPFDSSLIADHPVEPRDQARLLLAPRPGGPCSHRTVADLPALLSPGDLLVVNDTKVLAARLTGRKRPGGGRVELLLVRELEQDTWEVLLKGRIHPGTEMDLAAGVTAAVVSSGPSGTVVKFTASRPMRELIGAIGTIPLPPYIKRAPSDRDRTWYQTIFARDEGSIAAPTATLHFTERLRTALRDRGVELATITLHVGPATFRPVTTEKVEEHVMLPERLAKGEGRRVVAVGTTVVRALEAAADDKGLVQSKTGETGLFILPGYRFRCVDGLMTNFHLPRTTLIMLVAAFAGLERIREVYGEAVRERYRCYSYGDAMLVL